jgi:arylformamidase
MSGFDWRKLSSEQIEAQFNPRMAVPDFDRHFQRYVALSKAAALEIGGEFDLRYGTGPLQTYDLHKPADARPNAPLVIFIHGGYWRGLDKNTTTFAIVPFVKAGAVVVNLNYDLCPAVTVDQIVRQMQEALVHVVSRAVDWGADPAKIHVIGHSAGAHLAAMMVAAPWPVDLPPQPPIASLGLVSGVYELEPVLHVSVNADIRLDGAMAVRNSVSRLPLKLAGKVTSTILVACGDAEPEGWIAQSTEFHQALRDAGTNAALLLIKGADHFTIKFDGANPSHPLGAALLRQVGLGKV